MVPGPLTGASLLDFIPSLKAAFLFDDDFRRIAQALSFPRKLKSSGRSLKKCSGSGQGEAERAKRANKSRRERGIGLRIADCGLRIPGCGLEFRTFDC